MYGSVDSPSAVRVGRVYKCIGKYIALYFSAKWYYIPVIMETDE